MWAIYKKEINSFIYSLVAYLTVSVFLVITGLFLWVLPDHNVMEYGYAELGMLFQIAPYLLLFLIPAITMRLYSEEFQSGTIEWLFSKPIPTHQIVFGKYLASVSLMVLSVLPVWVYYFSIYQMGSPKGNIDTAGFVGSFIGLIFLGSVFCAIGSFSSSLSQNPIVSFIVAISFCYVFFTGLSYMGTLSNESIFQKIASLSLEEHYQAMGRGVLDSRDLVYFLIVIICFNASTWYVLETKKWN